VFVSKSSRLCAASNIPELEEAMNFTIRGAHLRTCGEGVKESQIFQAIGWLRARELNLKGDPRPHCLSSSSRLKQLKR